MNENLIHRVRLAPSDLPVQQRRRVAIARILVGLVLAVLWSWLACAPAYADDPSFGEARTFGTGSDTTTSVAVGDVDGDGDLDIVVGSYSGRQNAVYLNDGAGNFSISRPFGSFLMICVPRPFSTMMREIVSSLQSAR